jgi:aldehyde dehydrogenase (NAD+)
MQTEPTDQQRIAHCFEMQGEIALRLRNSAQRERRHKLAQLRDALLARRAELHRAFHQEFRKPAAEVDLTEFLPVVDEIRCASRNLRRWMRPRRVAPSLTMLGTSARVTYQGKGRCLIIGTWNYPVATLIGPLVSAVAAGNTVILKPSEFTPAINGVLAKLIAEVFDPAEVSLIEGGAETAQALLEHAFDHIFFTGSSAVGKLVMAAAARHLASVTLELGGKSPVIVDASADLKRAAETIIWGKLINAGQTCVAPDTLLVERSVRDELLRQCREIIAERYGQSDAEVAASADLARMINPRHCKRVAGLIDDAHAEGAELLVGGNHDLSQCYIAPTLLGDVPPTARIACEEIFGPVLPVVEFDEIGEVIEYLNAQPKPLALYLWSKNRETQRRILGETSSGGAVVNHCIVQFAHSGLPFGGIGDSGIGNAHGYFGFKAFSHERALLRGNWLHLVKAFFPPYGATRRRLIEAILTLVRRL